MIYDYFIRRESDIHQKIITWPSMMAKNLYTYRDEITQQQNTEKDREVHQKALVMTQGLLQQEPPLKHDTIGPACLE